MCFCIASLHLGRAKVCWLQRSEISKAEHLLGICKTHIPTWKPRLLCWDRESAWLPGAEPGLVKHLSPKLQWRNGSFWSQAPSGDVAECWGQALTWGKSTPIAGEAIKREIAAPGEVVAGGEDAWRAGWLTMAHLCPHCAWLGGRNRQGQSCLASVGRSRALLLAASSR